ncbi:MAG TPA: UDP-N-acetylglucosamine 1-carboxyvinyltransferase [Vitreimonas sp.]|uniref:UDP-N-acetylglucosamine 1-carboxyvinyltransferase n=1 Tax=Vitreimonas sp. TaxID=3069702 RepID=UPI002D487C26|nr:UDP-N-acetylglucosamine 1-carboxyvinyltransferase [Vitreimonas sp.]HYD86848.1 UDP-N-acetylglucosamine 1-carboxyvinyltransferase [Vitreimonas sp.]
MDRIAITGGAPLRGTIPIYGAKNSALKLQAAALLSADPLILENMPDLADTRFMAQLLASLGVEITWIKETRTLRMHAAEISSTIAPYDQVRKMRASFNVLGPLLARVGHATVSLPGGCAIGARPVDLHLKAFEAMGADIVIEQGYVKAAALRGLKGAEIEFPFVSVGATEHAMLAATLAHGETVLKNVAREPEIIDLADCLNAMGARIEGAGTGEIHIRGVTSLKGATHSVVADRIEAGTFALAAAAAGGNVLLQGARFDHLQALIKVLRGAGVEVDAEARGLRVKRNGGRIQPVSFETEPFPGFPTDLQAQAMALLCLAEGQSRIRETIFENRFMHAPELARLGAQIAVHGNEAVVTGVEALKGAPVMATDLRASVSLVIAGLAAEGETVVNRVYHLDRGFEKLEPKLAACGAQIQRLKVEQ